MNMIMTRTKPQNQVVVKQSHNLYGCTNSSTLVVAKISTGAFAFVIGKIGTFNSLR
jgi:hypothetical protein